MSTSEERLKQLADQLEGQRVVNEGRASEETAKMEADSGGGQQKQLAKRTLGSTAFGNL